MRAFKCERCGKCCRELMINIAYSDIERWLREKRWDILREVNLVTFKIPAQQGFYFGKTIPQGHPPCSFFTDNPHPTCTIYETRPLACRDYPYASVSAVKCPANPVGGSVYFIQKIRLAQHRDFKRAFIQREKICDLLKIVRHFKTEELERKWSEAFGNTRLICQRV